MADWINDLPGIVVLAAGVLLLLGGGRWLVHGSVTLASRLGLSTLLIGLTVVAFGTSSPELAFNLAAALNDNTQLCFGNVIGSNIANVCLVVGLSALVSPLVVRSRIVKKELPWLILVSFGVMLLVLMPPHVLRDDKTIFVFAHLHGLILLAAFALVMIAWYRLARQGNADDLAIETAEATQKEAGESLPKAIGLVLLGLACLFVGGKLAETGAVGLARTLGMSDALIGLTIVALATSLPEIFASAMAAHRGFTDLAVGNVVGSNLFNLLLVLGATSLVTPVEVPPQRGWFDLAFMAGVTLLLLPLGISGKRRIDRWEGLLLLACYAVYISLGVVLDPGASG